MLSPNVRNFVFEIRGVGAMVTAKEQVAVRCSASVAVHETVVVPSGNSAPGCAEQETDTGD
jgi:hypothetical protein